MLATPKRIDRLFERQIGRVVVIDDRADALVGHGGSQLGRRFIQRQPAIVKRFARCSKVARVRAFTAASAFYRPVLVLLIHGVDCIHPRSRILPLIV